MPSGSLYVRVYWYTMVPVAEKPEVQCFSMKGNAIYDTGQEVPGRLVMSLSRGVVTSFATYLFDVSSFKFS